MSVNFIKKWGKLVNIWKSSFIFSNLFSEFKMHTIIISINKILFLAIAILLMKEWFKKE